MGVLLHNWCIILKRGTVPKSDDDPECDSTAFDAYKIGGEILSVNYDLEIVSIEFQSYEKLAEYYKLLIGNHQIYNRSVAIYSPDEKSFLYDCPWLELYGDYLNLAKDGIYCVVGCCLRFGENRMIVSANRGKIEYFSTRVDSFDLNNFIINGYDLLEHRGDNSGALTFVRWKDKSVWQYYDYVLISDAKSFVVSFNEYYEQCNVSKRLEDLGEIIESQTNRCLAGTTILLTDLAQAFPLYFKVDDESSRLILQKRKGRWYGAALIKAIIGENPMNKRYSDFFVDSTQKTVAVVESISKKNDTPYDETVKGFRASLLAKNIITGNSIL